MNTNIKICLIEDDNGDYFLFKNYLGKIRNNYDLEWFNSYEKGLNAIKQRRHDIYFVDYTLGAETGIDLVHRALENNNMGPFIMLTGSDNPELYTKLSKSGVQDFILKGELSSSMIDRSITYSLERQRIENDLRKEKEFTSNIIREVPYMIIGISNGDIVFVNPATIETSGYSELDLMGKNWKSLFVDDGQKSLQFFIEGDGNTAFKKNILTASGEERIIQWNILDRYMVRDEDSNISLALSGKDITNEINEQRRKRQKDKLEALGHLAGGVAHEINNLLLPIQLGAELIQSKVEHDEMLSSTVEKILRNSKAAATIVEDILIFARQDKKNLNQQNFIKVFNESMLVVRSLLAEGIKIEISGEREVSSAICNVNEKDMIRVLSNILLNASHAMNKSGTIQIKFDITDKSDISEQCIQMEISDEGCGIDEEIQEKIFDPFFTTKDVGHGTGLGLPIVYNIISSWNGDIFLDSQVGKGTTFTILIPKI